MLSRKQEQAISALLAQPTFARAAKACGVSLATLHRWSKAPEFAAAYREARSEILAQSINALLKITRDAVVTLHRTLKSRRASYAAKVTASRAIFDCVFKGEELLNIEERLLELERNASLVAGGK